MVVLRPFLNPTVGTPQPVMASRRPRNMTERLFFQQQMQQPQQQDYSGVNPYQSPQQTQVNPQMPQFANEPITGDYIQDQLTRFKERAGPPLLQPGARVKSADAELVQPSTFQTYYEQLTAVDQAGKEMLGAETARAAFKRMEAMRAIQEMQVPGFSGLPIGYKRDRGEGQPTRSLFKGGNTPLSGDRAQARSIMQRMAQQWGWTGGEWDALVRLIMKESGFNPRAANPTSSARGLFQKMVSIHGPLENTIEGQILWGFNYIKRRYGSPSRALSFHLGHNWY